ncbi:MAG: YkgJ family cysteine cluster protein [Burkholderiales bacterium]|nr:MAG: YkgJ family cysteine cluster protein [Burkholderiales bacterium]TAG80944.1 MAG: YkgJ family cysteine cluster protein [Betaproteobacteria bacterium]
MIAPQCRPGCGACCIAPSISSPIPGMPNGKAAGVRCVQLDAENRCKIFGDPRRPLVCASLQASEEMCGASEDLAQTRSHAMKFIERLEMLTGGSVVP